MSWIKSPKRQDEKRSMDDDDSAYPKLLLLISRMSSDRESIQESTIAKIQGMITAQHLGDPEILDGSDEAHAGTRDKLIEISGLRGIFPQL
jgi:hypothetical protein